MNFKETVKRIKPLDEFIMKQAWQKVDNLVKPIGSLGRLEEIAVQISGITGKTTNELPKKCIVIMSSDNGVYEEGVSASPQELTLLQTINFTKGITGVKVLSQHAQSDLRIVDIGIKDELDCPGILNKKVRKGTDNMAIGPAMSREEAIKAIEVGINVVADLAESGYTILGTRNNSARKGRPQQHGEIDLSDRRNSQWQKYLCGKNRFRGRFQCSIYRNCTSN